MWPIAALSAFIIKYGYISIFLSTFIGGETLLLLAGFLSSLGYFNIFLVIIVATLGIMVEDTLEYFLGRTGRNKVILRIAKFLKFSEEKLDKYEVFFKKHEAKAVFFVRFAYGLRAITLISAGVCKMKLWRFLFYNFLGTLLWASIMAILGYYFGESWIILKEYIHNFTLLVTIIVILGIIVLFIISRTKKYLMNRWGMNGERTKH